jgi:hypothetical protein
MAFSFVVEMLNLRLRKPAAPPVALRQTPLTPAEEPMPRP